MSWELALLFFLGLLLILIFTRIPIAIAFYVSSMAAAILLLGWRVGPNQVTFSTPPTLMSFALIPVPLFVFMGELLLHSGLARRGLDALNRLLGRVPGRLSVLSMGAGAFFGVLSGSALANTSMLGSMLIPEMRERGYSKQMSAGPIMGAGPLALMLPPSAVAVLVGTIGNIPVGPLLIAAIVPGLLLAVLNTCYIIIRCWRNPAHAPPYDDIPTERPLTRLKILVRDVVPMLSVVLVIIVAIVTGIATPTEAAALGTLAAVILTLAYRTATRETFVTAILATVRVTGMILLIIGFAAGYSQILAYSGATRAVLAIVTDLPVAPLVLVAAMILLVIVMGAPLEQVSILLITLPVFVPIVVGLDLNPVWFGVLMMINMDIAALTPPLGLTLFVLKGVAPPDFSMRDIIVAAVPFLLIDILLLAILIAFPGIATWLPGVLLG